jgi:cyclic pyranopterin phosphate synthase
MQSSFSHLNERGEAHMVNIAEKPIQRREATAHGRLCCAEATIKALQDQALPKGDVLAVARIAGIQAAKMTSSLIPLCHQLPLDQVRIDFIVHAEAIEIHCTALTSSKTGVEMEALTGVTVAALTLYDMLKAVDKAMLIEKVHVVEKIKQ